MSLYTTPLRYPGGKQRIWKFIAETIESNDLLGGHYVEPFAGGAGVAMELLLNDLVSHVHLNDSCPAVYAFWHSVVHEHEKLCNRILSASMTIDEWKKQKEIYKNPNEHKLIDVGFALLYLNRCNRSGILTGGVIGGKNQDGPWKIDARFSRSEIIKRIERIAIKRKSIKVHNMDAEDYIMNYIPELPDNVLIYCDPPYFNKADRLYANYYTQSDHASLSNTIQYKIKHKWMVSYDNTPEILDLYKQRYHFVYSLQYNASRAYKGSEIFIFSDDLIVPEVSQVPNINEALSSFIPYAPPTSILRSLGSPSPQLRGSAPPLVRARDDP